MHCRVDSIQIVVQFATENSFFFEFGVKINKPTTIVKCQNLQLYLCTAEIQLQIELDFFLKIFVFVFF